MEKVQGWLVRFRKQIKRTDFHFDLNEIQALKHCPDSFLPRLKNKGLTVGIHDGRPLTVFS